MEKMIPSKETASDPFLSSTQNVRNNQGQLSLETEETTTEPGQIDEAIADLDDETRKWFLPFSVLDHEATNELNKEAEGVDVEDSLNSLTEQFECNYTIAPSDENLTNHNAVDKTVSEDNLTNNNDDASGSSGGVNTTTIGPSSGGYRSSVFEGYTTYGNDAYGAEPHSSSTVHLAVPQLDPHPVPQLDPPFQLAQHPVSQIAPSFQLVQHPVPQLDTPSQLGQHPVPQLDPPFQLVQNPVLQLDTPSQIAQHPVPQLDPPFQLAQHPVSLQVSQKQIPLLPFHPTLTTQQSDSIKLDQQQRKRCLSKILVNNTRSTTSENDSSWIYKILKTQFFFKMELEVYKDKIHTNLTNRMEIDFMKTILEEPQKNGLSILEGSSLQFYFSKMLPILFDEYVKAKESKKSCLYEEILLDYCSVFQNKKLTCFKEQAQTWWNGIFHLMGGGAPINKFDKITILTEIPSLSPDPRIDAPPSKRQKLSIIDEYLKNTKDRALLFTIDTEHILVKIIEIKIRWFKLVPSATAFYKKKENPPVFVTFCHSERSDSDLIFLIPARRKNKECNVELSGPKETERKHVDVICSNTWTIDHDNNRQKQNQDTPVWCHYECQSCAMSKGKSKGEKAKEYIEETNEKMEEDGEMEEEEMEDDEMEDGEVGNEKMGEEDEMEDEENEEDTDEDEDYENEEEIDQTEDEVIPNKSKTILLKICVDQEIPIIKIEEMNRKIQHETCGKTFPPYRKKINQERKGPKDGEHELLDEIYKSCIRPIRSKILNCDSLVQNGEELKVKVNRKFLDEDKLKNPKYLIPIAHMKASRICSQMLTNINKSSLKGIIFPEKFVADFYEKIMPLRLHEMNNKMLEEKMKKESRNRKIAPKDESTNQKTKKVLKKAREQSFGQADKHVKAKAFGCELLEKAITNKVNNANNVAYEISKILNFKNADRKALEAQSKVLKKMYKLGYPNDMNWNHVINLVRDVKKIKKDYVVPDWFRQKLAQSKISIRNQLMNCMVNLDGENDLNIVNIGGQSQAELPTSSKNKAKIYPM